MKTTPLGLVSHAQSRRDPLVVEHPRTADQFQPVLEAEMADVKSMRDAMLALETALLELELFADVAFDLCSGQPNAPDWPYLVLQHASRAKAAFETVNALEGASRIHAA